MEDAHKKAEETACALPHIEAIRIMQLDDNSLPSQQDKEITNGDSPLPLQEVELILGYEFKNKCLLEEAFTHHSYDDNCFSYERLEYIGDSVLDLLVTKHHFFCYPNLAPGRLTRLRAANVDTEKLARVAIKHGLHRFLRHKKPLLEEQTRGDSVLDLLVTKHHFFCYPNLAPGRLTRLRAANVDTEKLARVAIKHGLHRFLRHKKPLLEEQIQEFTKAISEYPLHSNGLIDVPKNLADTVESIIGAVFVDCESLEKVWKIVKSLLEPMIDLNTIQNHPVTELYEICQKKNLKIRFVDLWKESMSIDVFINEKFVGRGTYGTKKEIAHNRAAKNALDNIEEVLGISMSTEEDSLGE